MSSVCEAATSYAGKDTISNRKHDLFLHMTAMSNLCRICGRRALLSKHKTNKRHRIRYVRSYTNKISEYFRIDTSSDSHVTHPDKFCSPCYNLLMTYKRNPHSPVHQIYRTEANDMNEKWVPFRYSETLTECTPCKLFMEQQSGGRPKTNPPSVNLPANICDGDSFANKHYSNMENTSDISMIR